MDLSHFGRRLCFVLLPFGVRWFVRVVSLKQKEAFSVISRYYFIRFLMSHLHQTLLFIISHMLRKTKELQIHFVKFAVKPFCVIFLHAYAHLMSQERQQRIKRSTQGKPPAHFDAYRTEVSLQHSPPYTPTYPSSNGARSLPNVNIPTSQQPVAKPTTSAADEAAEF